MSDGQFEHDAHALLASASLPARTVPVRWVRRLLWPLVRPFHLVTVRLLAELRHGSDAQAQLSNARIAEVEGQAQSASSRIAELEGTVQGLTSELDRMQNMYSHLAQQILDQEARREPRDIEISGAIYGLQQIANAHISAINSIKGEMNSALNGRIDHVQRLYAHLADELPKFVQPIVDFRSESAAILNRFRIYGSDLDAVKARCGALELSQSDLSLQSGQLQAAADTCSEKLAQLEVEVASGQDQLRAVIDQKVITLRSESRGMSEHLSAVIQTVNDGLKEANLALEASRTDLLVQAGQLQTALEACNEKLDHLEVELAEGQAQLRSVLDDRVVALRSESKSLSDHLNTAIQTVSDGLKEANQTLEVSRSDLFMQAGLLQAALEVCNQKLVSLEVEVAGGQDQLLTVIDARVDTLRSESQSLSDHLNGVIKAATEDLADTARALEVRIVELDSQLDQAHLALRLETQGHAEMQGQIDHIAAQVNIAFARQDNDFTPKLSQIDSTLKAIQQALLGPRSLQTDLDQLKRTIEAPHIVVEAVDDGVVLLNSTDLIAQLVHQDGAWDQHVVEVIRKTAQRRSGVAVDVGAHCGLHTLAMARVFGRVLAFEPNDVSFRLLQANITLNQLDNVEAFNLPLFSEPLDLALGRPELQETSIPRYENGTLDMVAAPNPGSLFFTPSDGSEGLPFRHRARTLDSLALETLDFLKIDVQGADGEVLAGAKETIERCKPVIVFEWEEKLSENFSVSLSDVKQLLQPLGYDVEVLRFHNEKQCDYVALPGIE